MAGREGEALYATKGSAAVRHRGWVPLPGQFAATVRAQDYALER